MPRKKRKLTNKQLSSEEDTEIIKEFILNTLNVSEYKANWENLQVYIGGSFKIKSNSSFTHPVIQKTFEQSIDNKVSHYYNAGFYLAKSKVRNGGTGLYCLHDILKGEPIGTYGGKHFNESDYKEYIQNHNEHLCNSYRYEYTVGNGKYYICPVYPDGKLNIENMLAFVNEPPLGKSCNLFAYYRGYDDGTNRIYFFAHKNIPANQELYICYGDSYGNRDYRYAKECEHEKSINTVDEGQMVKYTEMPHDD